MAFKLYRLRTYFNQIVIPILLGLIVFSPFSSLVTVKILHLPFSLPELLFCPFIIYFIREIRIDRIKSKLLTALLLTWCAYLAISIISNDYELVEIIGCARTYLYIIIFFTVFVSSKTSLLPFMAYVSYGAIIGWAIDVYSGLISITTNEDSIYISYGPMIALPIAIGYPLMTGNRRLSFIIFICCLVIGTFGGLRRVLFITVSTYFLINLYIGFRNPYERIRVLRLICIFSLALFLSYPIIENTLHNYSWDLYVRIILKTEGIFNGESNSGDEGRNILISEYFQNLDDYILPYGFVSKQYATTGDGKYNDLPLTEISHSFGLAVSWILILYLCIKSINILKKISTGRLNDTYFLFTTGYVVIVMLLFMEGSFLTFPYQSIYTGYILSGLYKY